MKTEIKVTLNTVYYSDYNSNLKSLPLTQKGRLSKNNAETMLIERDIQFEEVFKVVREDYIIEVDNEMLVKQ